MNLLARPASDAATISPTLLVITDRFTNFGRLRKKLEAHGCNSVLATSREEAVHLNRQISFDGYVIDLADHDATGFALARDLHTAASGRPPPIVLLTSATAHPAESAGIQLEALELMSKGVDPSTLAGVILRLTDRGVAR